MPLNNYNQSYNPYYNPYVNPVQGYQNPYYYNPTQFQSGNNPYNPAQQQNPVRQNNTGLQGKTVDSLDVVKATDIPLDFSVSYFPLVDGSEIVTKQLQQDGTSKITRYKPVQDDVKQEQGYVTVDEMKKVDKALDEIKKVDKVYDQIAELKDTIKSMKKQIRDLTEDLEDSKKGK